MSNKKTMPEFAEKLCVGDFENLSKNNLRSRLIVEENWYASPFKKRFGITDNDKERFDEAFGIVISGVGGELTKINSAISSSLLSLLFFYKLFKLSDDSTLCIKIGGKEYNKVFFEVRNKCVGFPSCVDVVLQSTKEKTLLFLESKFTEYIGGVSNAETYGKSYFDLYNDNIIKGLLENQGIEIDKSSKGELVLKCKNGERKYIEGIKQSICHLIGLVQGPQKVKEENSGPYYDEYIEYQNAFKDAETLIYGTILFDPNIILGEEIDKYNEYRHLYSHIIGKNGSEILQAIKAWKKLKEEDINKIKVLPTPLTYQDIIKENPDYLSMLPNPIKEYYGFNKS